MAQKTKPEQLVVNVCVSGNLQSQWFQSSRKREMLKQLKLVTIFIHLVLPEIREDQVEQNQSYLSDKEQAAWKKGGYNEEENKSLYQPYEAFLISF